MSNPEYIRPVQYTAPRTLYRNVVRKSHPCVDSSCILINDCFYPVAVVQVPQVPMGYDDKDRKGKMVSFEARSASEIRLNNEPSSNDTRQNAFIVGYQTDECGLCLA